MISVGIGRIGLSDQSVPLRVLGLGSCVGVLLFNKNKDFAGLSHVMLPEMVQPMDVEVDLVKLNVNKDLQSPIHVFTPQNYAETGEDLWGIIQSERTSTGSWFERGALIVLPQVSEQDAIPVFRQAKNLRFAAQALDTMIKIMKTYGAEPTTAVLAGGAEMFENVSRNIGKNNTEQVKKKLQEYHIKIEAEDLGGNVGRSMILDWREKKILLRKARQETTLYSW